MNFWNKNASGEPSFLPDFLSEVSLLTDQDTDKESDNEKITMMTVHAAKVWNSELFYCGYGGGFVSSAYTVASERELEEERRLFYVAITRAEELCFISYSKSRFRNGKRTFRIPAGL